MLLKRKEPAVMEGYRVAVIVFILSTIVEVSSIPITESSKPVPNCKAELKDLSIPPQNMTPLTFNLDFLASLSGNGEDRRIGGAFYYALEVLEKEAADKGIPVKFTKSVHDTANLEKKAVQTLADLYCAGNTSTFIGPKDHCKSAGLMAAAYDIPYMTYGCQNEHIKTNQDRMINTDPSISYVSNFITAVLIRYHWSSFYLITGQDQHWKYTTEKLIHSTELIGIKLNGESALIENDLFSPYLLKYNPYTDTVASSKDKTRVYVFLGRYDSLIVFLRTLEEAGMTDTGLYVVIAATDDKTPTGPEFYLTPYELLKKMSWSPKKKDKFLKAFRNVLVVGAKKNTNKINDFEEQVFQRSLQPPFNFPKVPPAIANRKKPILMKKAAYHLYDATIIFGLAVMTLMGTEEADPTNTSQVLNYIKGRHHCSKQGYHIMIHENGETEDSYVVRGHTIDSNGVHGLNVVGSFRADSGNQIYEERISWWPEGEVPVSSPKCGFFGEECLDEAKFPEWAIAVIIIVIALAILGVFFKCYHYEKKLDRLLWKIDISEIQFGDGYGQQDMTTPKPLKKKESISNPLSTQLLNESHDTLPLSDLKEVASDQPLVGSYKGHGVCVKQLTRKHLELTRKLKKVFQLRKELTHDNISRFIGASIDAPKVSIVTEYCSRKSLQDILFDKSLPQEEMFVTSLVQDLINGMAFIHESYIGYHGNLKPSKCLVDKRWTLKITDFGLNAMGPPPPARGDDENAYKKLLWTAPELLTRRFNSSCSYISQNNSSSMSHSLRPSKTFSSLHGHSHHGDNADNSSNQQALQKGDVYSFAFILYELYGQNGPWGDTGLTPRGIIDNVASSANNEPFRPSLCELKCDTSIVNLICSCWAEEAIDRPDFKYSIKQRFTPKQKGSLMELYAENLETLVAERTEQLRKEKKMTENLLLRMLPRSVADKLMRGQPVQPEQFECVTIYFSDIVGFTKLSAECAPMEVVTLLNDLYTLFDSVIHKFMVYKVETIGDAYMVVSGLPNSIGDAHAGEIASMSLLFLQKLIEKRFTVGGQTDYMLKIRIGIHSGPCCAGVVGLKMPRYCLFGDTVNTANRMESMGEALKIHCSAECKAILDKLGGYELEKRGHTEVKGKGQLLTYFLTGEVEGVRQLRLSNMSNAGRCVSTSNLDYSGTPYNRRSAPPLSVIAPLSPKHTGARSSSVSLPFHSLSFRSVKNNAINASLNTSMDSSTSGMFNPNDSIDDTHSISDFRPSTLPRQPVTRQNSVTGGKNMSPIAEDPWSPSAIAMNEKGFRFHDNIICSSDTESECDTLLKQLPTNSINRNSSLHRQFSSENSTGTPETIF